MTLHYPQPATVLLNAERYNSEQDRIYNARLAIKQGLPGLLGPSTGFPALDSYIGGFLRPGIFTILAPPGSGKTSFALMAAGRCKVPAMFVTAEMAATQIQSRMMAQANNSDIFNDPDCYTLDELEFGWLSPSSRQKALDKTLAAYPQLHIYDAHTVYGGPSTEEDELDRIARAATHLKAGNGSGPPFEHLVIVVDSLTALVAKVKKAGEDDRTATESVLMRLDSITSTLNACIVLIVHQHRISADERKKATNEDRMAKGKHSAMIEHISHIVADLLNDNDEEKTQEVKGTRTKQLTLLKNRFGPPQMLRYDFKGRNQIFREWPDQENRAVSRLRIR